MVSIQDFEAAREAACACLFKGNDLLSAAMNEDEEVIILPSKITSLCDLLTAHRGKIQRVDKYLLRIAGDLVEHDGIISTTTHSLAWSFAHRLWLTSFNVLCEQAALKDELYGGGDGFHLDRDRLLANWKKIQHRLRTMKPIDAYRLSKVVSIESARAAEVLDPAPPAAGSDLGDTKKDLPPNPKEYLTNWREILITLGHKSNDEDRDKVRSLNKQYNGPIVIPGRGSQPRVEKTTLLKWWNDLEIMFQDQANQKEGTRLAAESQHDYGRDGVVAPELSGEVKSRRSDRKASRS